MNLNVGIVFQVTCTTCGKEGIVFLDDVDDSSYYSLDCGHLHAIDKEFEILIQYFKNELRNSAIKLSQNKKQVEDMMNRPLPGKIEYE